MADGPSPDELKKWHQWFAIECNNSAWTMAEKSARSEADDAELLMTAYASAYHWSKVGTDVHNARADSLLGHVHAILAHGELALHYARRNFDFVSANESPDWEIAFAHAILAHAASAAGDADTHRQHHERGEALAAKLDAEDKAIYDATFGRNPRPE